MKTNKQLGFERIARVGDYEVGKKGRTYRAYGYQWDAHQDAGKEQEHHEVCGRGTTAREAVKQMIRAAIVAGPTVEYVHNEQTVTGLTRCEAEKLRLELIEAIDEIAPTIESTHFTNFGVTLQPREADANGFLDYRQEFESLNKSDWTDAEKYIASQRKRIREWRARG